MSEREENPKIAEINRRNREVAEATTKRFNARASSRPTEINRALKLLDEQHRRNIAGGDDPRQATRKLPSFESVVFELEDHEAEIAPTIREEVVKDQQAARGRKSATARRERLNPIKAMIKRIRQENPHWSQERIAEKIPELILDMQRHERPAHRSHRQLVKIISDMEKNGEIPARAG